MADTLIIDVECKESKSDDESWDEYRTHAGVSLACVYCVETDQYEFYGEQDLDDLATRLEEADLVIGFNNVWFDHPVIDCAVGRRVFIRNELDLWKVISNATTIRWPKGSWKLDTVCQRTFGEGKDGSGEFAPTLAREGRWGQLVTYLIRDVWLTKRLYEFMTRFGYVIDPNGQQMMVGVKDA